MQQSKLYAFKQQLLEVCVCVCPLELSWKTSISDTFQEFQILIRVNQRSFAFFVFFRIIETIAYGKCVIVLFIAWHSSEKNLNLNKNTISVFPVYSFAHKKYCYRLQHQMNI